MAEYYTKAQSDAQASVIGARIKARTDAAHITTTIAAANDANLITDAERASIATIPPNRFLGLYASLAAVNTAHQSTGAPGQYAIIANTGADDTEAVWDDDAGAFIDTGSAGSAETAGTIKTKYESNVNTNAFTDGEKTKLAGLVEAADITAFTAALDAALA